MKIEEQSKIRFRSREGFCRASLGVYIATILLSFSCRSRLLVALSATGNRAEAKEEFEHILFDRLPFTSEEYAQSIATIAGVELSDVHRRELVLVD